MKPVDFILIAQSETIDYDNFSKLPLNRLELYQQLIYPRMVHYNGKFRSHLDLINHFVSGLFFDQAPFSARPDLLNIWNLPSFAGLYLANYLTGRGFKVAVVNNYDAEQDYFERLYQASGPDVVVGLSSTFHLNWASIQRLTKKLRRLDPQMHIISGGAMFPSLAMQTPVAEWEESLRKSGLRAVLSAMNSEKDLAAYLKAVKAGQPLDGLMNLLWVEPDGGGYRVGPEIWHDPETSGWPARWTELELPFLRRTVQLRTAVGCPFSCAFCSYSVMAHGYHPIELAEVERMLGSLAGRGLKQAVILDDTANIGKKRFQEVCRLLGRGGWEWFSFLRSQFIDQETAAIMSDNGCRAVYMGLESGSDQLLRLMNKQATRKDMERGIGLLSRRGISAMGSFIIGFPGETEATIRETEDFINTGGLDFFSLKEFFYISDAKLDKLRDEFNLEGDGSTWQHKTMTSSEASAVKAGLFKGISGPVHLDPDMGLWAVIAMTDLGFELSEVMAIQRGINQAVADQMNGTIDDQHPAFGCIAQLVEESKKRGGLRIPGGPTCSAAR